MVLFAEHHLTTLFFIIRHLLIIISLYTTYWFIAYNIINVATIDIIILIVIGAGAIVGFVKGFIRQLASILGLIVGLLAAKTLYAGFNDSCASVGFYHDLDCRTIDLCIDCLAIDKSNAGYFVELVESLVRKWAGST